jgi:FkbM family methyltransferase
LKTGELGKKTLKFACYSSRRPSIQCKKICSTGTWEDIAKIMPKLAKTAVPSESNVLDFGANIGAYSLIAAYYGFTVHAFEALAENIALFRASLCANSKRLDTSRVNIHHALVGDHEGSCSVYTSAKNHGLGRMCCGDECNSFAKENLILQAADMPILRLDTILGTEIQGHISFVKIDIEGKECQLLNGGAKLLELPFQPDMIKSEVLQRKKRHMKGCTAQNYLDRYVAAGYCVHRGWFQCQQPNHLALRKNAIDDYYMLSKNFTGVI